MHQCKMNAFYFKAIMSVKFIFNIVQLRYSFKVLTNNTTSVEPRNSRYQNSGKLERKNTRWPNIPLLRGSVHFFEESNAEMHGDNIRQNYFEKPLDIFSIPFATNLVNYSSFKGHISFAFFNRNQCQIECSRIFKRPSAQ